MRPDRLIGTTIADRYELIAQLGKGRGGVVYRARHRQLDRIVAVKVLFQDHNEDAVAMARFEREARSAAFLHHPNIVTIFDLGVIPDQYAYIVMEFIEGIDLGRVFGSEGRLPLSRAVKICAQICSALSHAHNRAMIHRDLKPSNIMLQDLEDYPDFVKIVDFGLAKRVKADGESSEGLTMDGQIFGTPAYMSPEQCQGQLLDGRSDVYALGCLCFKMLTGSMPHTGMSIVEIMHAHVHQPPHTFEEVYREGAIPRAVQQVIYKALAKQPDQRQKSMAQFRQELLAAVVEPSAPGTQIAAPAAAPVDQTTHDRLLAALQEAAQAGNLQSQYELSIKMEHGEGVPLNKDGAAYWLKRSAQGGFPQAQFHLGQRFFSGEGGEKDSSKAVFWYLKSAEQGNEQAAWQLANCFENGDGIERNIPKAISWYKWLLNHGNHNAEEKLSNCYMQCLKEGLAADGIVEWVKRGTTRNDPEALYHFAHFLRKVDHPVRTEIIEALTNSAQLGHHQAQFELGMLYLNGELLPRNEREAAQWFKAASDAGHLDGTLWYAACLSTGLGVAPDLATALTLLERAAHNGQLQAKTILGCIMLTGDGIKRNIVRGSALLIEAASNGDSLGQWKLALCHKSGIGAIKDPKKCEQWFVKSAERYFDPGPPWNWTSPQLRFNEAIEYFDSAAAAGNRNALYWMGIVFQFGRAVNRDPVKALDYYRKAAQRGLPEAEAQAASLQQAVADQRH